MTTAAAFLDHRGVLAIGADKLLTATIRARIPTKLHRLDPYVVAASGSSVLSRILTELEKTGAILDSPGALADQVLDQMKARGNGKQDDQGEWSLNLSLLIATPGKPPWVAHGTGAVHVHTDGYAAIGSGHPIASGVLFAARKRRWTAEYAVRLALEAANHHDPYTDGVEVLVLGSTP